MTVIDIVLEEIYRILSPGGEIFLTLCSKESWAYKKKSYPHIDANTILKLKPGPEYGLEHYHTDLNDILLLFKMFEVIDIKHIHHCFYENSIQNSCHYHIIAKKVLKV